MARATIEFDSGEDLSKAIDLAESSSYARDIKIISERPFTVEGSASVLATFKGAFRGKGIRAMNSNQSFSNGRMKAEAYLNQKMAEAGVRPKGDEMVMNAPGRFVMEYKGHHIQDYGNNKFVVFTHKGTGWAVTTCSSVDEAKKFIDSHKLPSPGSRVSVDGD